MRIHNLKSNWLIYETTCTTKGAFGSGVHIHVMYMYMYTCTTIYMYTVPHFQGGKFLRIFKFQNFRKQFSQMP